MVAFIAIMFGIAGCATSKFYVKDNVNYASYQKDLKFYTDDAKDIGAPHESRPHLYRPSVGVVLLGSAILGARAGLAQSEMQQAWIKGCMKEKGYVETQVNAKDREAYEKSEDPAERTAILRRINSEIKAGKYKLDNESKATGGKDGSSN